MKIIGHIIILIFVLSQLGCVKKAPVDFAQIVQDKGQPVKAGLVKKPVKIAFATPLKQVSDYWRRSIDSFKGRMDELGIPYEVSEFSTKADESRKLKESIQLALQTEPDYLVVTPNDAGDEVIISRLLANRKVKVIVQNVTIPHDEWKINPPFLYVGFDHTIGAARIADEYTKRFNDKKNVTYGMLYFIKDSEVSKLRGDYFNELIAGQTDFKLVAESYTGGIRERSREAALKMLAEHPEIDFIHACSTDVAFGAVDALKETGLAGKVVVNGWGGGSAELDSLLAKELDFTVMRMNDDNGVAMAEAIRLDLEGKDIPQVYSGDMVIVSSESNVNDIEGLKKRSFRYSGN